MLNIVQEKMSENHSKNSRRKRRDPQSRDFLCKCGKSYLSYAAAYTHVKNKHQNQKQFFETIQKPQRQKLKRGRPKQKKLNPNNIQTQALSIIQDAILKICNIMKNNQIYDMESVILKGNQEVKEQQLQKQYQSLNQEKGLKFNLFKDKSNYPHLNHIRQFEISFNKHFSAPIAAKIRLYLNYLMEKSLRQTSQINNQTLLSIKSEQMNIWGNLQLQINQIVSSALENWTKIIEKNNYR